MQIVIDIDEHDYKNLMLYKEYPIGRNWLEQKVIAGTPLPKGHGRLIDESKIAVIIETEDGDDFITDAPTIIEADK